MNSVELTHRDNEEDRSRKVGFWISVLIHVLMFLILLIPILSYPIPPPGQQGIWVSFGDVDEGQGQGEDLAVVEVEEEIEPAKVEVKETPPPNPTTKKAAPKKVETSTLEEKVNVPSAKDKAAADKVAKADAEAKIEAENKRKADAEAQRIAEAERKKQEEYDKKKSQFGNVLGNSKGDTGKSGNQGDPSGDPNADMLSGLSKGSGRVGGGLGNRGVVHEPIITDSSQKIGKVVVNVCVDKAGRVISSKFTQKGSTTTDSKLIEIAEKGAAQYQFSPSEVSEQCGTITVDFKLK